MTPKIEHLQMKTFESVFESLVLIVNVNIQISDEPAQALRTGFFATKTQIFFIIFFENSTDLYSLLFQGDFIKELFMCLRLYFLFTKIVSVNF